MTPTVVTPFSAAAALTVAQTPIAEKATPPPAQVNVPRTPAFTVLNEPRQAIVTDPGDGIKKDPRPIDSPPYDQDRPVISENETPSKDAVMPVE